jgi:hypothetical protein
MDYGKKKVLIRAKANYKSSYCDLHDRGIYEGRNLNKPILNKFDRKEISFLNYHECLKHWKSRIVCKFDLIKRKIIESKEGYLNLIPSEKLANLVKI